MKTLQWFQQQYPNARVSEINAAIGGTGSMLGPFDCIRMCCSIVLICCLSSLP